MATNKPESATTNEEANDDEPAVSMLDVLQEEEELEADANAVLGDSDPTNCTYIMGYVPRQALYACMTCDTNEPSGICLACSNECHDGHDLVELYTKRNFRCDCGNGKFRGLTCKLFKEKSEYNVDNRYNQNFRGVYCTCERPYPDPQDDIEDEMIQCIVCEDWYHGRHLGLDDSTDATSNAEMICRGCMSKHDFLWAYTALSSEVQKLSSSDTPDNIIDVVSEDIKNDNVEEPGTSKTSKVSGNKRKNATKCNKEVCQLKELQKREIKHKDSAAFFSEGWRKKLCACPSCMEMYNRIDIEYLTDESDTFHAYELRGKQKTTPSSQYDKGLQALSNMNRLQQVEVLHGYNDMKSELSEYLKKFAENKKVVREEDIREFFSTLQARKRQKTSEGMSYYCK